MHSLRYVLRRRSDRLCRCLKKATKPERADDRAFYMNLAMNGLVKEGYELAGMNTDEIVMKRPVAR